LTQEVQSQANEIQTEISQLPIQIGPLSDASVSLTSVFLSKFTDYNFVLDFLNVCLYPIDPTVTLTSTTVDINKFFKAFIRNITRDLDRVKVATTISPKVLKQYFNTIRVILDIKQDIDVRQVTYDNIFQHFQKRDIHLNKLLQDVVNSQIKSLQEYRAKFNSVTQTIQTYNVLRELRTTFVSFDSLFQETLKSETPISHALNKFKEVVFEARNRIATLDVIQKSNELSDYILINNDSDNIKQVSDLVITFLRTSYSFYKTGYSLIDTNIGGIESSSVSIIAGPSNHAKSIFMLNILKNMAENNEFQDNDVLVLVTLEDDIYKLLRRVISIFGNYETTIIKRLFVDLSEQLKRIKAETQNVDDHPFVKKCRYLIQKIIQDSIRTITKHNVSICLIHSTENTFTTSDLSRKIDKLILEGYNVKVVAVDYIDVMAPATGGSVVGDDYNAHGQIVHELRILARLYKVPVLTITQNVRSSEDPQQALSNQLIGDSHKKVRYSDYIFMIRTRYDLDIVSDAVRQDIGLDETDTGNDIFAVTKDDLLQSLYVFEVKTTKAKDAKRDIKKYHIFNGKNIRIYDNISQVHEDLPKIQESTHHLEQELSLLLSEISIGFDPNLELDYDLI